MRMLRAVLLDDLRREQMADLRLAYFGNVLHVIAQSLGMSKDAPQYLDMVNAINGHEKPKDERTGAEIVMDIYNKL